MDQIIFNVQEGAMLFTPCIAAMRRNPPASGLKRSRCMADIERVETGCIRVADMKEDILERLMSGMLEYQNQMNIPFCFAETGNAQFGEDFFRRFGFHYIYDRPQYELNTKMISKEMLERAAAGEIVSLSAPKTSNITLQLAEREDMLSLAHFVNARLCRQYGLFMIRSASYFEQYQEELQSSGGNLYQIMENGIRKGYFACMGGSADEIKEAVFDQDFDQDQYLLEKDDKKPAVMARIANLSEMLRHIAGKGKIAIAIRLQDPVIAENDGLFIWYIDDGGSHMERVEQADPSVRPEVTATIGEFTAFVFEYIKLKQNAKFDSIYLSGPVWINER